jgi:hypothetical protein
MVDLGQESPFGELVEFDAFWMLCPLAVRDQSIQGCVSSQVRVINEGSVPQCKASILFQMHVHKRSDMQSQLRSRLVSVVVNDWQMKWAWKLMLDKISKFNESLRQQYVRFANPLREAPRRRIVAEW